LFILRRWLQLVIAVTADTFAATFIFGKWSMARHHKKSLADSTTLSRG
jgi:cytochrome oxidase assembly protein ShyY1